MTDASTTIPESSATTVPPDGTTAAPASAFSRALARNVPPSSTGAS